MKTRLMIVGLLVMSITVFYYATPRHVIAAGGQYSSSDGGTKITMLAKDIISTGNVLDTAFSPDKRECYFSRQMGTKYTIMVSKFNNGAWNTPEAVSFSGVYPDVDPVMSRDGARLYFSSKRPQGVTAGEQYEIWVVDRQGDGWSEPWNFDRVVNSGGACYGTFTADESVYFHSYRPGGKGLTDIFKCKLVNGKYSEPENLGEAINTDGYEIDPCTAPDESFIIFNRRAPYSSRNLLMISYRRDGIWTQAKNVTIQGVTGGCIYIDWEQRRLYSSVMGNIYYIELSALDFEIPFADKYGGTMGTAPRWAGIPSFGL